jgi:DNA-binding NarL/FixJ family response regulator
LCQSVPFSYSPSTLKAAGVPTLNVKLEELGHRVVAEAGDVEEAAKPARSADFDLAILDVNVRGKLITAVAELIKGRGRPIIFAIGCGSAGLPEEFRDFPTLPKSYQMEALAAMIDKVVHPRAS